MCDSATTKGFDLTPFEGFIATMAERASRLNRGSYSDFEDYVQIGRIAAWQASLKWPGHGSFPCYARMAIRYEIINAAIKTRFPVSAPRKVKRAASVAASMMVRGRSDAEIKAALGLENDELACIRQMIAPVSNEGV